jgi:hypothetical protein
MAKQVQRRWTRVESVEDEFFKLMPVQYAKTMHDSLGNAWQQTATAIVNAEAYLEERSTHKD